MPGKTTETGPKPRAAANGISKLLDQVLGPDRFPVDVKELALQYSKERGGQDPIMEVRGEAFDGLEGMLVKHATASRWRILYNNSARIPEGRQRFTIAHEFGHYVLHRNIAQQFECSDQDIATGDNNEREREAEADLFASTLLMPLNDFRRQVEDETISFALFGCCADRYGVSLTAAALRWIEIAPKRAVLVASRDDYMLWAKSNEAAFRSRAYFATRKSCIELPKTALAHSHNALGFADSQWIAANTWFPFEPPDVELQELTFPAGGYDYTLTLLLLPEAHWRQPRHDDEQDVETVSDRLRSGRFPGRR